MAYIGRSSDHGSLGRAPLMHRAQTRRLRTRILHLRVQLSDESEVAPEHLIDPNKGYQAKT